MVDLGYTCMVSLGQGGSWIGRKLLVKLWRWMKDRSANAAVIAAVEPLKAPPRIAAAAMTPGDGKVIRAITSARSTTRAKISSGLRPRASEAALKAGAVKNMHGEIHARGDEC